MNKMKKKIFTFLTAFTAVFLIALPASAHVTVKPTESTTEAWENYTVKIPVEKEIATTKVTIKIPDNVEFKMYEPVDGWKVTTEKNDSDKIISVTWEAENDDSAIQPGQYKLFSFTAQNPSDAGEVAWDAFQYYADESIVEWTGNEDAELPHSITEIAKSDATTDSHGHTHDTDAADEDTESADDHEHNSTSTILSIIAIVISVIAIIMTFIRRK